MRVPPTTTSNDNTDKSLRFGRMAHHLIEALPLGVVAFDRRLKVVDSNPAAQAILGDDLKNIAAALAQGTASDGQDVWHVGILEALATGEPQSFEHVNYRLNGNSYVLRLMCTPLYEDSQMDYVGGTLLIEDFTAKAAMEEDLASSERLAAVGKLAARIAHELNNPLDGILRYINLALRTTETDENEDNPAARYLTESRKGILRMVQILSELLEFSRSTYSACEDADINKIVEEAVTTMSSAAQENKVKIVRLYADQMPNVRSGNLFQVFCNLVKNAIDAMETTGGTLTVSTCTTENAAVIEFTDEGPGLNEEVRRNLFEPFFTTKKVGKGTGLGLAICKDIVERYTGHIKAANSPQGGSVFTVSIPLERTS